MTGLRQRSSELEIPHPTPFTWTVGKIKGRGGEGKRAAEVCFEERWRYSFRDNGRADENSLETTCLKRSPGPVF